ncbi:MAG: lipoprotein signal peptidase [Betaproteobacteria bacterium]|nr:lipoprotein signal peptidase [Betaproteobacteria bacterium]
MPERPTGWFRWLGLSAAVLAIDLATKAWASAALASGEPVRVTGFFNLVLVHNTGAAFSFLANAGGWQRWFFVGVTIAVSAVLLWLLRRDAANRLLAMAYALVLGGAAGNLWDRLTLGKVVDFIQLHAAGYYWPAFNAADSAITLGVILLLWDGFRDARARPPAPAGESRTGR